MMTFVQQPYYFKNSIGIWLIYDTRRALKRYIYVVAHFKYFLVGICQDHVDAELKK